MAFLSDNSRFIFQKETGFYRNERKKNDKFFVFVLSFAQKLHQIHAELPNHGSYIEATFPFSTNPDGFDTYLSMDLKKPVIRTNLSFSPLLQAEHVDVNHFCFFLKLNH